MIDQTVTRRGFLAASATLGLMLAGCGGEWDELVESEEAEQEAAEVDGDVQEGASGDLTGEGAETDGSSAAKVLVAFYSRADENYPGEWLEVGHTKVMAGYIAEALGADTCEIVPVEAYPEGYDACCDQAMDEQRNDARPAIANALPDVSGYDTVFLGCPIWWGEEPMIVRTFIEGVDLSGKTIVPFTTHGGSGLGSVQSNLQAAIPGATFLDGHAVTGTAVDGACDEVVDWAKGLALA